MKGYYDPKFMFSPNRKEKTKDNESVISGIACLAVPIFSLFLITRHAIMSQEMMR